MDIRIPNFSFENGMCDIVVYLKETKGGGYLEDFGGKITLNAWHSTLIELLIHIFHSSL